MRVTAVAARTGEGIPTSTFIATPEAVPRALMAALN